MKNSYAIEAKNLTKSFGDSMAVRSVNLAIGEGELFGLLGINGAGKTTLIRMLCRMLRPTEGEMLIKGQNISNFEAKKRINFSPQENAFAQGLTVRENLELMAGMYGLEKKLCIKNVGEVISRFDLREVQDKKAKTLSGGWQRRLSIAMALVTNPDILFLDEPTLGLDVIARRELWQTILQLKSKTTIILTTHYLEEAEHLCDRIAVMSKGMIMAVGTPKELEEKTGTENFEEAFIGFAGTELRRETI